MEESLQNLVTDLIPSDALIAFGTDLVEKVLYFPLIKSTF